MILRLIDADIERALARLPEVQRGTTPSARDLLAVKHFLLMAKGRLKSIERRPDPAGSTEWGQR